MYIYIINIHICEYTLAQIEYRYTRKKNHNKKIKRIIYIYWEEFKPCEL